MPGADRSSVLSRYSSGSPGLRSRWACLGCGQYRDTLGAKGQGLRKRCQHCVEAKEGKKP